MDIKSSEIVLDNHTSNDQILFDNSMSSLNGTINKCNVNAIMQGNCNLGELNTDLMDNVKYNQFNNNFGNENVDCKKKNKIITPQNTIDIAAFDSLLDNHGFNLNKNINSMETSTPHLDTEKLISQINTLSNKTTGNTSIIDKNLDSISEFDTLVEVCDKENKETVTLDKANMNIIADDSQKDNTQSGLKQETFNEEADTSVKDEMSHVLNPSDLLSSERECLDNVVKSNSLENTVSNACNTDVLTQNLDPTESIQEEGNTDKSKVSIVSPPNDEEMIEIDNKDTGVGNATDLDKLDITNKTIDLSEDKTNLNEDTIQIENTQIFPEQETKLLSHAISEGLNTSEIDATSQIAFYNELLSSNSNENVDSALENTVNKSCINNNGDSIQDEENANNGKVSDVLLSSDTNKINDEIIVIDKKDDIEGNTLDQEMPCFNENTMKSLDMTETLQDDGNSNESILSDNLISNESDKINKENISTNDITNDDTQESNELKCIVEVDKVNVSNITIDASMESTLNSSNINDITSQHIDSNESVQHEENSNEGKISDALFSGDVNKVDKVNASNITKDASLENTLNSSNINDITSQHIDINESVQHEENSNDGIISDVLVSDDVNKTNEAIIKIEDNKNNASGESESSNQQLEVEQDTPALDLKIAPKITIDSPLEDTLNSANIDDITAKHIDINESVQLAENSNEGKISDVLVSDDTNKTNGISIKIEDTKNDASVESESSIQQIEVEQDSPPLDLKFAEQIISVGAVPENIVTDTENLVEKTNTSGSNKSEQNIESALFDLRSDKPDKNENLPSEPTEQLMKTSEKVCDSNLINISNNNEEKLTASNTDNVDLVDKLDIDCSDDEGVGSEYSNTESSVTGNDGAISPCNEEINDVTENVTELEEDLSAKHPGYDRQISDEDLRSSKGGTLRRLDTMDYISDDEDSKSNDSDEEKGVIVQKRKSKRSKKRKVYRAMDSSLSRLDTVDENSHISLFEKDVQGLKHIKNKMKEVEQESINGESTSSDIDTTEESGLKKKVLMNSHVPLDFTQQAYTTDIPIIPKNNFVPEVHTQKESKNEPVGLNMFGVVNPDIDQEKEEDPSANIYVNELFDGKKINESPNADNDNFQHLEDILENICLKGSNGSDTNVVDQTDEENDKQKVQGTLIEESKDEDEEKIEAELSSKGSEVKSEKSDAEEVAETEVRTDKDTPEETAIVSYGITGFMYDVFTGMFSGMKRLNCTQPGIVRPPSPPSMAITESDAEDDNHTQDMGPKEDSPLTLKPTDSDNSRPRRPSFTSEELFASEEPFLCYENSVKIV